MHRTHSGPPGNSSETETPSRHSPIYVSVNSGRNVSRQQLPLPAKAVDPTPEVPGPAIRMNTQNGFREGLVLVPRYPSLLSENPAYGARGHTSSQVILDI